MVANTNTQIQKAAEMKPAAPAKTTLREYLELRRSHIAEVLPRHMTPERLIKVALTAYNKTPSLMNCTFESLFLAIMQAAELGLEPGGPLKHAHLVPYKDQCTLIVGYGGYIELARRSGEIESIEVHPVYERDRFTLKFGLNTVLEHEPFLDGDAGPMKLCYAVARLKGGGHQLEVMTYAQIKAIGDAQLAKIRDERKRADSPWNTSFSEMARKTLVRRIAKYLPLSPEKAELLAKALELENDDAPTIDIVAEAPKVVQSRTAAVLERVKEQAHAEPAHVEQPAQTPEHDPNTGEVIPPAPTVTASPSGKVQIVDQP